MFVRLVYPSRLNKGSDKNASLPVPLHPGFYCSIVEFAYIALRAEFSSEMPKGLKNPERMVFPQLKNVLEIRKLWMFRYGTEGHYSTSSFAW